MIFEQATAQWMLDNLSNLQNIKRFWFGALLHGDKNRIAFVYDSVGQTESNLVVVPSTGFVNRLARGCAYDTLIVF